jgi:hypothetical protein
MDNTISLLYVNVIIIWLTLIGAFAFCVWLNNKLCGSIEAAHMKLRQLEASVHELSATQPTRARRKAKSV